MIILFLKWLTISISMASADGSSESLRDVVQNGNRTYFILTFKESAKWTTQVFESIDGDLEDRIFQKTSSSKANALFLHSEYFKKWSSANKSSESVSLISPAPQAQASAPASAETLWPITQNWDWQWELQFSDWIKKSVDRFFFIKYNLPTDCADVIIGLRWIFSRMNGLPVANTLSGSGRLVGHMTIRKEWRDLPTADNWYEDQKFLAALSYIFKSTYTESLGRDSYPIKIDRQYLIPGAHHLEFHERGGHAMIVKDLVFVGKKSVDIIMMDSTLPVEVRRLTQKNYMYGIQPDMGTGFQRLKWPQLINNQWLLLPSEDYPGYSTEQNEVGFMIGYGTFSSAVKAAITGNSQFDITEWTKTLKELENKIKERSQVIVEGFEACLKIDCSPGTEGWQAHSTPNRDSRLQGLIVGVLKTIDIHKDNKKVLQPWEKLTNKFFSISKTQQMSFKDAIENMHTDKFDSDPRKSVESRWGL